MITIGQTLTTSASGITGTVQEVAPNKDGRTVRVRITLTDGTDKWTTVTL